MSRFKLRNRHTLISVIKLANELRIVKTTVISSSFCSQIVNHIETDFFPALVMTKLISSITEPKNQHEVKLYQAHYV